MDLRNAKKEFLLPLLAWRLSKKIPEKTTVAVILEELANLVGVSI